MAFSSKPSSNDNEKRDYYREIMQDTCPLPVIRLKTNAVSVIRITPEFNVAGQPMPAVVGTDNFGPLWSNIIEEDGVILAGQHEKHCGFVKSLDRPGERELDNPWRILYVYFKGQLNNLEKNKPLDPHITPELVTILKALFHRTEGKSALLQQVAGNLMVQGWVMIENGVDLKNTPKRAIISMGNSIKDSLMTALKTCALVVKADPFAFDTGYQIRISGKASGQGVARFYAELGDPVALPANFQAASQWVPWDRCLKFQTYDENVRQIVRCYGAYLISQHPKLREDMVRLAIPIPSAAAMAIVGGPLPQPASAPAANAFAPAVSAPPATLAQAGPYGMPVPAAQPATNAFGAPVPTPMPTPAGVFPAFSGAASNTPVAPSLPNAFGGSAPSAPQPSLQPSSVPAAPPVAPLTTAPGAAPAVTDPAALDAAYQAMIANMSKKSA